MSALAGAVAIAATAPAAAADRPTPSGYPVPRYITLKFGKVNARAGPGDDHRLLWVFRTRGLPVQVIAETAEWRRVCDPEGGVAWVHKRVTDGRRSVLNMSDRPQPLYRRPKAGSRAVAFLNTHALASLDRCEKGWCRVKAGGVRGWTPEGVLWGSSPDLQCH